MNPDLGTTNLLLGIMAAVSVLEALLIVGVAVAGIVVYRKMTALIDGFEHRQLAPAVARVNAILDDVKGVTAKVKEDTERVDSAIRSTLDRVDDTTDRVRQNMRMKTNRLIGVIRGVRVAIDSFLNTRDPRAHEHY